VRVDILSFSGAPLTVANLPYSRRGERPDGSLYPEDQPERVDEWNSMLGKTIGNRPDVRILDFKKKLCPEGRTPPKSTASRSAATACT